MFSPLTYVVIIKSLMFGKDWKRKKGKNPAEAGFKLFLKQL